MAEIEGSDWSRDELNILIDSYIEMLAAEVEGYPYNKRDHNRNVQEKTGRSAGSIEFKLANLSAVLQDNGLAYIDGYKPRSNYQGALKVAVTERLKEFPFPSDWERPEAPVEIADSLSSDSTPAIPEQDVTAAFREAVYETRLSHAQDNKSDSRWDRISQLWDKATGGQEVAERPDSDSKRVLAEKTDLDIIQGPRPPGVEVASKWFQSTYDTTVGLTKILLLVGGPGAGKSHTAKQLVKDWKQTFPQPDNLAHRTYEYNSPSGKVVLVNDATIPSDQYVGVPLVQELEAAISNRSSFLGCVNRGILVEELRGVRELDGDFSAGKTLVDWVHSNGERDTGDNDWQIADYSAEPSDYLLQGTLMHGSNRIAEIVAVFVDVCSLLERSPQVSIDEFGLIRAEKYVVGNSVSRLNWHDPETPAGKLLTELIAFLDAGELASTTDAEQNAVLSNLKSLENAAVRAGLLTTLRSAEISSGQRFSYREIWGAFVRAIVGDLPEKINADQLVRFSEKLRGKPEAGLQSLIEVARYRMTQAIFGVGTKTEQQAQLLRNPVTRLTHKIDPMRDAIPGKLSSKTADGWATALTDAFSSPNDNYSPLETLLDELSEEPRANLQGILTDFDRQIDKAFVETLKSTELTSPLRRHFVYWYAQYLGRLYAMSNGVTAFRDEISQWTEACELSPQLPDVLKNGLRTLLRPKRNPFDTESRSLIPVLDSRTDPITGSVTHPKFALMTDNFEMGTVRIAESLFLTLTEDSKEIARMPLDLPLIREAGASSNEFAGMTELSDVTSPRLERFRSARLVSKKFGSKNYRIVQGSGDVPLAVNRESGKVGH